MSERAIEAAMRKKISALGGLCLKWVSPGCDGVPDRIVILPGGRIVFVELKTDGGRLRRIQEYQHKLLEKLGCEVTTVYGEEDMRRFCDGLQAL